MLKYLKLVFLISIISMSFDSSLRAQETEEPCPTEVSKKSEKLQKNAMEKLKEGDVQAAQSLLEEALQESPENLKALWSMGELNRKSSNRYAKPSVAIDAYSQIIALCPSYQEFYSYYHLGKLYYNNKNWQLAYENLDLFVKVEGNKVHEKHLDDALDLVQYAKFYADLYAHPVPFEPKLVDGVSTPSDEYLPSLSPDNDFLYYTRVYANQQGNRATVSNQGPKIERFCVSKRKGINRYDMGEIMPFPFNEQPNEGGAALTIDNRELYYTRCVISNTRDLDCDICYSRFENDQWSDIEILGSEVNTSKNWESMPTISSDGKTLYFVSDRPGGFGGYDIYMCRKNKEGQWLPAVNMGPGINTAGNEKSPFIHTDSQTLYFSSADRKDESTGEWFAGHMGLGGYDIFFTRLTDSNIWISPKNIGYPINSEDNDLGFFVSTNGKYGYLASNKLVQSNGGNDSKAQWDIYSFELYTEAQPQKVLFVKGKLTDEISKENLREATIEITNVDTKEVKSVPVNQENGEFVVAMVMKSDYIMTVKQSEYAYINKYIGKTDTRFDLPISMEMKMQPIQVGKTYNIDDVYFDTDSDNLTAASVKIIESFKQFLVDNPTIIIEIQGHTDDVGSADYNLKLSEARAKTVNSLLIQLGVEGNRLSYKGLGESQPMADNKTEDGRAKNRRTVFLILDK